MLLKRLLGGKCADLDNAVSQYLEDMLQDLIRENGDKDAFLETCANFIPDWDDCNADIKCILDELILGDAVSLQEGPSIDDAVIKGLGASSIDDHQVNAGIASVATNSAKNNQQGSSLKNLGAGVTFRGPTLKAVIEELLQITSVDSSAPVDDVILEYLERAAVEYMDEVRSGVRSESSPDDLEDLHELIVGCVPDHQITDEHIEAFVRAAQRFRPEPARNNPTTQGSSAVPSTPDSASLAMHSEKCDEDELADEREEDWTGATDQALALREMFPTLCRATIEQQLRAGGTMEQIVERMVHALELAEASESLAESRRAQFCQEEAFEKEARESARLRALARYDKVEDYGKVEGGKRMDVGRLVHTRSAQIDKAVEASFGSQMPKQRFINNEVVTHKGERFIVEKKLGKNAVPEDPATFIGLKIKAKGKRGPSPAFK